MKPKFKVGDKVLVRSDLITDHIYARCVFVSDMTPYKGKVCTISHVFEGRIPSYHLLEDPEHWFFTEPMFLSIKKNTKFINLYQYI